LNAALSLMKTILSHRPTPWHGESGAASSGGHVTVDFLSGSGAHVTTHHIYRKNRAYEGQVGRNIGESKGSD
jgi:hypothetical protein